MHGDLRGERVVLRNGITYVINFPHRRVEHQWTGRRGCFELIEACRFLPMNLEHPISANVERDGKAQGEDRKRHDSD